MSSPANPLHHPGAGAPPSTFEEATYRKVAWRLTPLLMLSYVVAYLDRVNVGFAKLGMSADLGLSDAVYGFGAGIFFIGYFIFEVPSNVILHRVGARVWIARIMVTWGIVSMLTMFVTTPTMFYVMRFLLGLAEAGFFPGIILYLTYWYPAHRRGRMTTWFMTAIAISGVVGGPTYLPFIDFTPTLQPFIDLYQGIRGEFFHTFLNSTIVGLSAAAIATAIGAMAAYALVRFEFKVRLGAGLVFFLLALGGYLLFNATLGLTRPQALLLAFPIALIAAVVANRLPLPGPILGNEDILFWFVSQRMFPPIVTAFALYLLYSEIGRLGFQLIDSFVGLTLCYVAFSLPIVVWLMRDFFEAIPIEVEEAAMVDNVPSWRIFLGIVVPMSMNGLLATFMITLAFVWNEFLFALFLTNSKWQTLPILVAGQNSQRGDEWWAISAAALVAIIPMMIMAGLLSRMMRSGLLLGAIK